MVRATVFNLCAVLAILPVMGARITHAQTPAYDLLPDNTQAVVWIRDSDELVERWSRTQLAQLTEDPAVRPFFNDQREALENRFMEAGWRLNVTPEDISAYATGQIALAWLELANQRKPFGLAMIVDVADDAQINQRMMELLDQQLSQRKPGKAKLQHEGVSIVKYTMPKRADQLLAENAFYAVAKGHLLATDDESLIKELVSRVLGKKVLTKTLAMDETFIKGREALGISGEGQAEYFVRPLGVARVLRAIGGKRSKSSADLLVVLQNQGFGAIKCVCGEVMMGKDLVDIQHRGYVLTDRPLPMAAGILDFPNEAQEGWRNVPSFVSNDVSAYLVTYWNSQQAFWKAEGLVDELAGTPGVFDELINGIKLDPNGPRIDIEQDVLPNLTNDIFAIADDKPGQIDLDSRRNLIALKVKDTAAMRGVLDRAMGNEPDASAVEFEGTKIWVVAHREDQEIDPLAEDFGDFGAQAPAAPASDPLLNNWAITVYEGYLMFASHVEMIEKAILQAKTGVASPLSEQADYQRVVAAIDRECGENPGCGWQIIRNSLAYRVQYELFRAGKLRESQSMIANLLDSVLQNESEIKEKVPQVDGKNLPPYETIAKFLQPGGLMVRSTESGWEFGGLMLSDVNVVQPQAVQPAVGTARVVNSETDAKR